MMITAFKNHLQQQKHETPERDKDDENIIRDSERFMSKKDTAIKEENAEFDTTVCEFLDDDGGISNL